MHPLWPALERGRSPAQRAHDPLGHRDVVLDDTELRHLSRALGAGEDHAVRVRDPDLSPVGVDEGGLGRGHVLKFYATEPSPTSGPDGRARPPTAAHKLPATLKGARDGKDSR